MVYTPFPFAISNKIRSIKCARLRYSAAGHIIFDIHR